MDSPAGVFLPECLPAHPKLLPLRPSPPPPRRLQGISDADVGMLQSVLEGQISENLGMAMIYTLISAAQEWVTVGAAPSGRGRARGLLGAGDRRAQDACAQHVTALQPMAAE